VDTSVGLQQLTSELDVLRSHHTLFTFWVWDQKRYGWWSVKHPQYYMPVEIYATMASSNKFFIAWREGWRQSCEQEVSEEVSGTGWKSTEGVGQCALRKRIEAKTGSQR